MKDKRLIYIISGGVLVLIVICAFFFIHMPLYAQLQKERTDLKNKETQFELVKSKVQELNKLRKDLEIIQKETKLLADKIPQQADVPQIVDYFEEYSRQSGIIFVGATFKDTAPPANTNGTNTSSTNNTSSTGNASNNNNANSQNQTNGQTAAAGTNGVPPVASINVNICEIKIKGSYAGLTRFFTLIKTSPRLFGIQDITLGTSGDGRVVEVAINLAYFNYNSATNNPPVNQ